MITMNFKGKLLRMNLIKVLLLENKVAISSFYNGLSGIKEMSKNLIILKNEYYEKTQALSE